MVCCKEISWEEHKGKYCNEELVTKIMRKNIPLLDYVEWEVVDIKEGYCKTKVTLKKETTNQHKTLQAANYLLAADYTGGIASGNIFKGLPTFGIHDIKEGEGLSIWLVKSEIKYKIPACGDLYISSQLEPDSFEKMKERVYNKRTCVNSIKVDFMSNDKIVSQAVMTYFTKLIDYSEWKTKIESFQNI
jgi:hypothetical protein